MKIRKMTNKRKARRGMVLVVALLIMAMMSIIGATAITTSRIDIKISQNTKVARQAFYYGEAGLEQGPKYIRAMIEAGAAVAAPGVTFSGDVFNEVMNYIPGPDQTDYVHRYQMSPPVTNAPQNPDVTNAMGDASVIVDIDRRETVSSPGSGVEFGAGSEGVGVGSAGGVLIYYDIDSVGTAPNNAESYVDVYYRLVVGTAGGK